MLIRGMVTPDATNGAILRNTATVSATTPDPNPGNNTATDDTPVGTSADLSITKVGNPSPIIAGRVITYTITVTNNGPSAAGAVTVTDAVPASVMNPQYSVNGGSTWSAWTGSLPVGSMAAGGTYSLLIRGTINPVLQKGDLVSNTATVTSPTPDPNPDNNTATHITPITIPHPYLSILKEAIDNTFGAVGDIVRYRITVLNTGNDIVYNIRVTDNNAVIVSGNPIARLAPAEKAIVMAEHTVTQADLDAGRITNTATVYAIGPDGITIIDFSNDVVTNGVFRPQITITKYASETTFKAVGDSIHYTMELFNCGNVTAACWIRSLRGLPARLKPSTPLPGRISMPARW
jgi:uncharacterized repeat protein (TIGR01451 family)